MSLWICTACTTRYSVGAPACPQCSASDHLEVGAMPKIHADGRVTDAAAPIVEPEVVVPEVVVPEVVVPEVVEPEVVEPEVVEPEVVEPAPRRRVTRREG